MNDDAQKKLFYKCDVIKCENKVISKGALCKSCLDKFLDYYWIIYFCTECFRIIDITHIRDFESICFIEKINASTCEDCSQAYPDDFDRFNK